MKAIGLLTSVLLLLAGCAMPTEQFPPLPTVESVDLDRYAGTWHEIARYPNRFQRDCARDSTAVYAPLGGGRLEVRNRCVRADGTAIAVTGVAEIVEPRTPAKLKVSFLPTWLRWSGLGRGDYWVLYLSADYRIAVIGEPSREFLWILARTPQLSAREFDQLLPVIRNAGYRPERLLRAPP